MRKTKWTALEGTLRECFEGGMSDAAAAKRLSRRGRKINEHMVRAKRRRMEQKGTIPKGLATSSRSHTKGVNLPKKQVWTEEADAVLIKSAKQKQSYEDIATELVRKKLRRLYNPKAVSCRASTLGVAHGIGQGVPRDDRPAPVKVGKPAPKVGKSGPVKRVGKPLQKELPLREKNMMVLSIVSMLGTTEPQTFVMTAEEAKKIVEFCVWLKDLKRGE